MPVITPDLSQQWEGATSQDESEVPKDIEAPLHEVAPVSSAPSNALPTASAAPADNADLNAEIARLRKKFPSAKPTSTQQITDQAVNQNATMWHKAGTPPEAGTPEMGWGEAALHAGINLVPSTIGALKATGTALIHPIDTLGALKDVGVGAVSKAEGALGMQQDPKQKAKDEALIDQLADHYKQVYGSEAGFKKAFAEDPASIFMDAASIFGGAGAIAKLGGATKFAELASLAASKIDPVSRAVGIAGGIAKAPVSMLRGTAAAASGVPTYLQQIQTKAGAASKPMRDAYRRFASGQGDPSEYLNTASRAVQTDKSQAVADYLAQKGNLRLGDPSFHPIEDAIAEARRHTRMTGPDDPQFRAANEALDEAEKYVNAHKNSANPEARSIFGFDNLKQAIGDLKNQSDNSVANRHLGSIYNSIKSSIREIDPAYDDLMEKYSTAMNGINDAQRTLIGGDRIGATAALAKSLRAVKDSTGVNMIERMAKHEPTLPYMLAGHAASPATAGVMRGIQDMVASSLLGYNVHPLAGAATMVAGSPKIVGALNYGAGRIGALTGIAPASRLIKKVASKVPTGAAYYAGRANQENQQNELFSQSTSQSNVRSERNNNMGNIRDGKWAQGQAGYKGADADGFAIFDNPESGRAASENLLAGKLSSGLNTPRKLINTEGKGWDAKANPNYAKHIADKLGIGVDDRFDENDPVTRAKILDAIHEFESGIPTHSAIGGRIERASGGRVDPDKLEKLVGRMMSMARRAKKGADAATEPLLNAPDEAIVKALDVAQQAI